MPRVLIVPDLPLERWPSMDRYALRLVNGLAEEAPGVDVTLASPISPLTADTDEITGVGLGKGETNEVRRYLARYWRYPRRVKRHRADLMHVLDHSYAHTLSAQKSGPSLVTVHDLLPVITVQRKTSGVRDAIRNRLLEWVLDQLRRASGWIVATEWLRGELAEWLGHDDRIHVVPYGVDEAFLKNPVQDRGEIRRAFQIPESAFVVLHVGSVGPRKNIGTVIATVDALRQEGIEAWLLQVGGTFTPEQMADIASYHLQSSMTGLGATEESELRRAYRAADVLLFPSHYEGFGLPVLEAMASELPAVNSGAGGLTELSGNAAVVVGGREVEPYVKAVAEVATNESHRAELVRLGVEQARKFRWAETARKTAAVYDEYLGRDA
jgi:glycosyltransferase involved in cell wall biosynthesis